MYIHGIKKDFQNIAHYKKMSTLGQDVLWNSSWCGLTLKRYNRSWWHAHNAAVKPHLSKQFVCSSIQQAFHPSITKENARSGDFLHNLLVTSLLLTNLHSDCVSRSQLISLSARSPQLFVDTEISEMIFAYS